jgi:hypothetical protein
VPPNDGLIGIVPLQVFLELQKRHTHAPAVVVIICETRAAGSQVRKTKTKTLGFTCAF